MGKLTKELSLVKSGGESHDFLTFRSSHQPVARNINLGANEQGMPPLSRRVSYGEKKMATNGMLDTGKSHD